MNISI
jgi:hypothetical protein